MPDGIDAVTGHIAWFLVRGLEAERFALERPFLLAVVAVDHAAIAADGVAGGRRKDLSAGIDLA